MRTYQSKTTNNVKFSYETTSFDIVAKILTISIKVVPETNGNTRTFIFLDGDWSSENIYFEHNGIEYFGVISRLILEDCLNGPYTVQFELSQISPTSEINTEQIFKFFIPKFQIQHSHYKKTELGGSWHNTPFEFKGKSWKLVNAYPHESMEGVLITNDIERNDNCEVCGTLLITDSSESNNYQDLAKDASSICMLIGLAQGQHFYWYYSLAKIDNNEYLYKYSGNIYTEQTKQLSARIITDHGITANCTIGNFIECVAPSYLSFEPKNDDDMHTSCWSLLIYWYCCIRVAPIEIQGIIVGMLLDKLSLALWNQQDKEYKKHVLNKRRTKNATYKIRLELIYKLGNPSSNKWPELEPILEKRNALVHQGVLDTPNRRSYHTTIHREITAIMYAMLGYSGYFHIGSTLYNIKELFPEYQNLILNASLTTLNNK